MTLTLIASGIIAPALLWIGYFYYKDRHQPEPFFYIGISYILGFAAAYLCFKSYGLLSLLGLPEDASLIMDNNRLLFFFYCLGVVGILEELLKFLPFILLIVKFKCFDEKVDGIIYASVIALGFASYENLHYLPLLDGFALFGRAIASPLTHTIFASIWGYWVGTAYLCHRKRRKIWKICLTSLLAASLLHGIFDFLTTSPALRLISTVVILAIWIWQLHKLEKLYKEGTVETKIPKNIKVKTAGTESSIQQQKKQGTFFSRLSFL
jgi:RsiW-degrading membrane proteinase PrsW (M82 family)